MEEAQAPKKRGRPLTRPKEPIRVTYPRTWFERLKALNKRMAARHMFIYELLDIREISTILGETPDQVAQWGLEELWEEKRLAMKVTSEGAADILENKLMEYMMMLENGKMDLTEHAARLIKTTQMAITALRADKNTLRGHMCTMELFIEYLKMTRPELLTQVGTHIEAFLMERRKKAGM